MARSYLRSSWDTHRHRSAPQVMAVKERLEAEKRLTCHRGHILGYRPVENCVEVTYRSRGTQENRTFAVRQVRSCTGPQSDYRKLDDLLVNRLLERDLIAPDPLRIGAYTGQDGRVLNQTGEPIAGLYTLGSPRMGLLYESIVVPELRGQAAALAKCILRNDKRQRGVRRVERMVE
jgi:uncharacterized NAD(P)/FAD-binding protein YdhS